MALTHEQWRFIAHRLLSKTDQEAAKRAGLRPQTIYNWKNQEPEFVHEYEAAFKDGVEVAKSHTRQLLGKAAQTLAESLDATRLISLSSKMVDGEVQVIEREVPDHRARLEAVKLLFQTHSLLTQRLEASGPAGGPLHIIIDDGDNDNSGT